MDWRVVLSLAGVVVGSYSAISYIRSILAGVSKPHRGTWGGWTIVGVLGLVSSLGGGAGIGLLVAASFVIEVAIIFAISCLPGYGKPGATKLDYIAAAIAGLALLTKLFVDYSPNIGQFIAIAGDLVFLWPTLREAWRQPEFEAVRPWAFGAAAEVLGILTIGKYTFAAAGYSVYILLGNLSVIWALEASPHKKETSKKTNRWR